MFIFNFLYYYYIYLIAIKFAFIFYIIDISIRTCFFPIFSLINKIKKQNVIIATYKQGAKKKKIY